MKREDAAGLPEEPEVQAGAIVNRRLTRRQLLAAGAIGGVGLATGGSALALQSKAQPAAPH